jgi:SprT protein
VASADPAATLDAASQAVVTAATMGRIGEAAQRYGVILHQVAVLYDLHGTSAGMYCVRDGERWIRYNPWIFARHFEENLRDTVAHEVAHYVVDRLFGRRGIKPHGRQWRAIMRDFGVEASVRHDWDIHGLPLRRQRRFSYRCACTEHLLTTVRHNRILSGRVSYHCRHCGANLRFGPS